MRKLIHVVNINDFFPELFALTYPTIRSYAERNGYMINMITEIQIQNFLYEIDEPIGEDNAVLSDDQIFSLANKIFNNQKILLELIKSE